MAPCRRIIKGAVKKWLIFYQIARQSSGRRLIFNELTQKGSPLQCHFDRSGVEWSGEISLLNGTNRIVTGDLGALSLNRAIYFFLHIDIQIRSR